MDWYDVEDVLYDGTKEEIANLKCPGCDGEISFRYDDVSAFEVSCKSCGYLARGYGGPRPNCADFFGNEYTIAKQNTTNPK